MKEKHFWKDPCLYIAVLLNVAVHHVWFFSTAILTHGDSGFNFPEQIAQVTSFQVWSSAGLGGITTMPSSHPYIYLAGLLARAGISSPVIQRIIFFWPMVIVGSIGSYLLIKKVSGSGLGGLLGSIVFNFNTFFIISTSGHITIATAIAWFPLAIYLFMIFVEKPTLKSAVVCTLPLFIISLFEFRVFYVCSFALLLFYFFSLPHKGDPRGLPSFTALFFLPIVLTILLNAYWLISFFGGGLEGGLEGVIVGRALFSGGSTGTNGLHNALTLFAPMWSGGKLVTFSVHSIPPYWFLVPIAAFSTLFFDKLRKDRRVLYFAFLALVGIFLTKFFYPPFPGVYEWLYNNFPGFNAFREPSKFPFLIYMPYAVLLGCLVGHLQQRASGKGWKKAGVFILAALIALPFLLNAVPVASGSAGTLFVGRELPDDYEVFKEFVRGQPEYFRTLWVPTYSRWSYYDDQHPMISCVDTIQDDWKALLPPERSDIFKPDNILYVLQRPYAMELLRNASVKFVVVPLQDTANDDDFFAYYGGDRQLFVDSLNELEFLEREDIGTGELVVYRNRDYEDQAFAADGAFRMDADGDLDSQFLLAEEIWGADLPFTLDAESPAAFGIEDLLATEEGEAPITDEVSLQVPAADEGKTRSLRSNRGMGELNCLLAGGKVVLKRLDTGRLLQGARLLAGSLEGEEVLQTLQVDPGAEWWLEANGVWMRLEEGRELKLGEMGRISSLRLYRTQKENLIPDGSFEEGPWQGEVTDDSEGGSQSVVDVERVEGIASEGTYSLQIEAVGGVAGAYRSFAVEGDRDYCLSFDYRSPDAKLAGYSIHFNDEDETVLSRQLPVSGLGWTHYQRGLRVPTGASVATLYLYSYGDEDQGYATNLYDDCELRGFDYGDSLDIMEFRYRFEEVPLQDPDGELELDFQARESSGKNLISNPSFEGGTWGEEVTDSNEYDDQPVLAMALDEEQATHGRYSLRLETTRHLAATYTVFPVEENRDYFLNFDYQSPNASAAGFSLHFNDEAQTIYSERLPVTDAEWQHLQRSITSPLEATVAVLYVYGYESDGFSTMINRYDNFSFFKVTSGTGLYYLIDQTKMRAGRAEVIDVVDLEPTRKMITVESNGDPFVLILGQGYDADWTIESIKGLIADAEKNRADTPEGSSEQSLEAEVSHFSADGNLNAWRIDPVDTKDGAVGTNDTDLAIYQMVLEFTPQAQVAPGSAISFAAGLAILIYLLYLAVRSVRNRVKKGRVKIRAAR